MVTMKKEVNTSVINTVKMQNDYTASFYSSLVRSHPEVAHRSNEMINPFLKMLISKGRGNMRTIPATSLRE